MAATEATLMAPQDPFADLARYYDALMARVEYDRWYAVASTVATLLPRPFLHVDAACGTCTLLDRLRKLRWRSMGIDLSLAMLRVGKARSPETPVAAADLRAFPFSQGLDYITCLFDSINFLPTLDDVGRALRGMHRALNDGGILYFDIVTERMVTEHFEGPPWTERHGYMTSAWKTNYSRDTRRAETRIQVNKGPSGSFIEYMYDTEDIERAVADAGFRVLAVCDAETWRRVKRKTVRIDFIAAKNPPRAMIKGFRRITKIVRSMFV